MQLSRTMILLQFWTPPVARNGVYASQLRQQCGSRAKQFSSVQHSAKVASCHATGDQEGKVQELGIIGKGEGPEPTELAGITVLF